MAERQPGRPEISIDMKVVEHYLICGCSGTEVAAVIGVHPDTLYERVQRETGKLFSNYSAECRQKGDSVLREAQYIKAVGNKKKGTTGDNTMLVWLGKNRLLQRDAPETQTVTEETIKQFNALMEQFQNAQNVKKEDPEVPSST